MAGQGLPVAVTLRLGAHPAVAAVGRSGCFSHRICRQRSGLPCQPAALVPGGILQGRGGPGGASSITGNAGAGADGAFLGGGGGGGGAALSANTSGAGGKGADGAVFIICW